ncbi:hypothetical protein [Legionella pneumophila]|uniref:hypothetical protein n=1 Tax=Legionella pneumophila TaxID=446 RepID=UPI002242D759|nr:hypothetical protein [Legionella pneumophila]MCW8401130.1 hypothetical protein [Legionella pneumophila]MCZ4698210.1 hypothetical protein [Legionella pneumophila]MCZ4713615.1 hypothetical protein [Legionella pneumophila]MCZ4744091.1 hypothetical protein [Legionella pneumophila]MCZ4764656.1 hypothetical protein [Legionella pneumophila]
MLTNSTDLDELSLQIRNFYVKKYIIEAINSYRGGSYRASIISTWIAVCVDVIEKIKELAEENDGQAKELKSDLDSIKSDDFKKMLSFEKEILNYAHDRLELISLIEKVHLERLYQDRNICAHPTFITDGEQFNPSPELAKSYIVQAAQYLLIHRPTVGKVVLEKTIELIWGQTFPDDDERAYILLSSEHYLKKAKDSVIRNLLLCLLKKFFSNEESIDANILDKLSSSLKAISRINEQIYSETLKNNLCKILSIDDENFKKVFLLVAKNSSISEFLDEGVRIRLHELIKCMKEDELLELKVSDASINISGCVEALRNKINSLPLELLRNRFIQNAKSIIFKEDAINIFLKSSTFDLAKDNGEKFILPYAQYFNLEDLNKLINGIIENKNPWPINQIIHAGGMDDIFRQLYQDKKDISGADDMWIQLWETILAENANDNFPGFEELLKNNSII